MDNFYTHAPQEERFSALPPPQDDGPKDNSNMLPIALLIVAFFMIGLIAALIYYKQFYKQLGQGRNNRAIPHITLTEALTTKGRFAQDQKVATVGDETLYGKDLNYILYTFYNPDFASSSASLQSLQDKALLQALNDSIILQASAKEKLITLSPTIFNNLNKDHQERQKVVSDVTAKLQSREERVQGAMISVWFHNIQPPSVPLEEAEKIAMAKIQAVYNDILTGTVSFENGGKRIFDDTSLAKIDTSYQGNAYYQFDKAPSERVFTYNELEQVLTTLKEGSVSGIIRVPSASYKLGQKQEEFYAILKVFKREHVGSGSFITWLDNQKKLFKIQIL